MSLRTLSAAAVTALSISIVEGGSAATIAGAAPASTSVATVFATGLDSPRGLAFDKDGTLYVAEGGTGGTTSTVGQCLQVPPPVGPYTGAMTGRISKISRDGTRTTVVDGLPSSQTGPASGGLVSGVADVTFAHGRLVALISGAGCSHGLAGTANEVLRVSDGKTRRLANLSAFLAANPVANPDDNPATGDFEPDGTWYSFVAVGRTLYATEPNHQEIDRISANGHVSRVVDFSRFFPGNIDWRGPTGITYRDGWLYVGTLTPFPINPGKAQVFKVNPRTGDFTVFADGLSTILGLSFDENGALYVLEMNDAPGFPSPGNGKVIRISGGSRTVIVSGLSLPTGMAFGPDHNLYVSVNGLGFPPGAGQIMKISVPQEADND
ncbi:MAG TPA: ScyD/ScyE family protein [Candidatus Dormibacteraeota bacterium]|nr:ScyD/ScyE family protein [Candidatus Dormibacteraeota bacterium]